MQNKKFILQSLPDEVVCVCVFCDGCVLRSFHCWIASPNSVSSNGFHLLFFFVSFAGWIYSHQRICLTYSQKTILYYQSLSVSLCLYESVEGSHAESRTHTHTYARTCISHTDRHRHKPYTLGMKVVRCSVSRLIYFVCLCGEIPKRRRRRRRRREFRSLRCRSLFVTFFHPEV